MINSLYLQLGLNRVDNCSAEEKGAKGRPEQAPGSRENPVNIASFTPSIRTASINTESLFLRYNSEVLF